MNSAPPEILSNQPNSEDKTGAKRINCLNELKPKTAGKSGASNYSAAVQLQEANAELIRARGELLKAKEQQAEVSRMRYRAEASERLRVLYARNYKERKGQEAVLKIARQQHHDRMREQYQQVKQLERRAQASQVDDVERKRALISTYKAQIQKLKSLNYSLTATDLRAHQQQIGAVRNAYNCAVYRQRDAAARRQQIAVQAKREEEEAYLREKYRAIEQIQRINQQKEQIARQIQRMAGAE